MARTKGKKRGSPIGQEKPFKRPLVGYPERLAQAMVRARFVHVGTEQPKAVDLANAAGCTKATVGQHLAGKRDTLDAVLLMDFCDALSVTPWWLALNQGTIRDVPLGQRPMATAREKRPGIPITNAREGSRETQAEGTRSGRATARVGRSTA